MSDPPMRDHNVALGKLLEEQAGAKLDLARAVKIIRECDFALATVYTHLFAIFRDDDYASVFSDDDRDTIAIVEANVEGALAEIPKAWQSPDRSTRKPQ